jgi:ComEC/Rec2-related protein
MRPPKGPAAEGLFDYRAYLRWQGVYYELRAQTTNDWQLLPELGAPATPPLADRFLTWAQATLERGLPDRTDPEGRRPVDLLLWMTLGLKTTVTDEVSEPFMFTGTMHIFAISGLHIALISGILVALLRVLQAPRAMCGWLVIPLIWFYTAATGWQPSAIRSAIMMTVIIIGWMLRRPGALLNSLAGSAFIILLWEPRQLFQASFQLSFFVVLSIGLMLPPLETVVNRVLQTDPFLPEELLPRWRRWLGRPLRWLLLSLATSFAAWLGSLPLIAWYFHLLTPVSLLANLVIVPVSGFALMCNLGSLFCGGWLPLFTEWFNHAGWFLMASMDQLSRWAAAWPGAYFYVPAPGLALMLAYYAVLAGLLSGWLLTRRRRAWTAAGAGALLLAAGGYWLAAKPEPRITVLALNGGAAQYVRGSAPGEDLLIDCGDSPDAGFVVKPFLKAQGVNQLRHLILTHGDLRHVGGYEVLSEAFRTRAVATSYARARSPVYRQIVAGLEDSPRRWVRLQRGQQLAGWTVLHPGRDQQFSQADDNALVLRREWRGTRVLLLSDLGKAGQGALLEQEPDLRADMVVTGLPARGEPLSDELLAAIQPQLIVVNDAEFPALERAGARLRERLERAGRRVVYTSDEGSVTIRFKAQGWELRAMSGKVLAGPARKGGRAE